MFKEFKEFAMRGNVIDMAVGIVIGGAFTNIVNEIVSILMNIVSVLIGSVKFDELAIVIAGVNITYGAVIQSIISFIIVAFAMFVIIKAINKAANLNKKIEEEQEPTTKTCPYCMSEIPVKATRCPACTSILETETISAN